MKILLAVGRDPWPPRRGDQLRANQLLEALGEAHEVTVLAPFQQSPAGTAGGNAGGEQAPVSVRVERYRRTLAERGVGLLGAVLGGRPVQSGLYVARELDRRLGSLAREADLVVVQLARLERAVRRLRSSAPRRPVIVDLIDALSLGVSSRARVDLPVRRPLLRLEARRLRRLELELVSGCAAAMVVAARDREAIAGADETARRRLSVVPLALDAAGDAARRESAPGRVVLSGNLGYFVNRDAVLWTLRELWPALREARPGVELLVAGARPDAGLRRAVARAGAQLLADPTSLAEVLSRTAVSLAPMRCGSGTPVKILEAWAAGVPVVASPYAAAGTLAVAGRELLVAERREQWLASILRLLDDRDSAARLVASGRALLEREHSRGRVREALAAVVESATGSS